jgi:cytochrome c oxidase subunit 2
VTKGKTPRLLAVLALLALAAAGCARNAPLDTLRPAGPIAQQIKGLWDIVFAMAVVVFVVVEGLIVFLVLRFRHRKGDDSMPKQVHGNTRLEFGWTVLPALILAALAIPTVLTIFALAREPADALRVNVRAQQWWWQYQYPGTGVVTANELHIPVGRKVLLSLRSRDIIHSWWAPRLAGKQDVVPGWVNHLMIEAGEPGTFDGQCVEYCGLSHANMRLKVVAQTPADFQQWLADQAKPLTAPTSADAMAGQKVFLAQACTGCHAIRGTSAQGEVGPDLTHFASRSGFAGDIFPRTDAYLRKWLSDAPAMKPGSKMPAGVAQLGLSQKDITVLIAFLQSLQ